MSGAIMTRDAAVRKLNRIKSEIGQLERRISELSAMVADLRADAVDPGLALLGLKIGDRVTYRGGKYEISGAKVYADGSVWMVMARRIKMDGTPSASEQAIYHEKEIVKDDAQ